LPGNLEGLWLEGLNTESYRMNAAKLAKNHPNKTPKTRAKNTEKSDVK
jgi:hypothetical protein